MIGIYKITNKTDGKVYIGQSTDIKRRFNEHKQKRFVPIDMIINIIGADNFDFDVIEECSIEELDEKEKYYIAKYDSINNGYNKLRGGTSSKQKGENNPRAILTEKDVIDIRIMYNKHVLPRKAYEKYKNRVSKSQFQAVWQGKSWPHILPEVFTEENKEYYIREQFRQNTSLTKEEVLRYRQYYVNHTAKETYEKMCEEKGAILKEKTFKKILNGDTKNNSLYQEVPVYKKRKKQWELNGEPVSTSCGSAT